jgi:hypothetical protein
MNTAISKTAGVIEVEALSTHNAGTIIEQALCELTNMRPGFLSPLASAKRVIFWHRVFTGGLSPIVVISATDRKSGDGYAALTPAVRTLVDRYNLRVVVDGSPSTLDESLFRTKRQRVFEVRPMTKEMVWQIGQFQQLFQYVKKANLEDTVFAVLGGIPADYQALWDYCATRLRTGRDAREVIGAFLCSTIYTAMTHVNDARAKHPATAQMVKLFQEKSMLTMSTLLENNLVRPIPDKVFREVEQNGVPVLIPDSNAIGIVLRHHLTEEPSLDELEKLLKKTV